MFNLHHTASETNPVADNLYRTIKECPFEENKDVTGWSEAGIIYDSILTHFFGTDRKGVNITKKYITIEDPVVTTSTEDMNSYLVVILDVNVLSGRFQTTYKFPIDY